MSDESTTTDTTDVGAGDGVAADTVDTSVSPVFETAPDWLPEKFHVVEGDRFQPEASFEKALQSYRDLESTFSAGKDKLKEQLVSEMEAERKANVPEAYEINMPKAEDIGAPEGIELSLPDDDPLLSFWKDTAKAAGLNQEQFDAGVKQFIQTQIANLPDVQAEMAKLGEDAQGRVDRLERKIAANVPEEVYESLVKTLRVDAGLVEALEHITDSVQDPGPGAFDGTRQDVMTRDDVKEMMNDERYINNDPAYHAKVAAAWRQVAGTKPVPGANRSGLS